MVGMIIVGMGNEGEKGGEKMLWDSVWLRGWGGMVEKMVGLGAFPESTIWGDFGISSIWGENMRRKGGLIGN